MSDPTHSLIDRLRTGKFSAEDIELAAHAVEQRGIPAKELRRIRYAAIRKYRDLTYPKIRSLRQQAQLVERDMLRYAASSWRHDANSVFAPARIAGTPVEHLWRALRHGPVPDQETLRSLILK